MAKVPPTDGPVIIKKYGNRRLYDTRQSKYITLEDLAGIVQAGDSVKVIDSSTERDLTRQVLTQVILEQQETLEIVPVELLHAVIRVRGTLEQVPFAAFLSAVTGQFLNRGNQWTRQLADLMGSFGSSFTGGSQPRAAESAGGAGAASPSEPPPEPPAQTPGDGNLDDVRGRMNALLDKMKKG
ncbi:MAG: polyhydroxyalkanoate synthesis regulator DNA-binding domain-containing protein [bacterium]